MGVFYFLMKLCAPLGIVLVNINQRLVLFYGPEYQIRIKSTEGSGTRTYLMIPQNTLADQRKRAYG